MFSTRLFTTLLLLAISTIAKTPEWVEERPASSSDYIGIAMALKEEYNSPEEWRKAAELRALTSISSDISVSISGKSSIQLTSTNEQQQEQFKEDIETFTKANLKEYEFVDSWENRKEFWVYYKLNKAKWAQVEQQRLNAATAKSLSFISNAEKFESQNSHVPAIRAYIQAFSAIVPVFYLNPVTDDNTPLVSQIDSKLSSLLTTLQFINSSPLYRGTRGELADSELLVTLQSSNGAVASYPLTIEKHELFTNNKGLVPLSSAVLETIDPSSSTSELLIKTDLNKIISYDSISHSTEQWLRQLKWPTTSVQFVFEKPAIYIESEKEGYADLPYDQLETAVKMHLDSIGFGIARFPEDAALRVVITSSTRPAGSMGNLYFTYMDVTWSLFNSKGDELVTQALKPVKGGALSYDDAGIKAYSKGAPLVAQQITSWIKENQ